MGSVATQDQRLLGQRYRLIEQLGAGGMSVVWRACDEVLGRQVAVKVLASQFADEMAFRYQLRTEAQAAARLCHPHIANVYDYGESEEFGHTVPYVVMELVDGASLSSRLGSGGTLPWREAVRIVAEVSSALAAAHARGVVHRDVTPSNVMLTVAGAKVVDFGISALVGETGLGPDGAVLGTPAYLAPERLDNRHVTAASDVYAVGLLLYRTLTGRLPWRASTTTQMLSAHIYADPEPMPEVLGLPGDLVDVVHLCLAKCPEDRPTAVAVARTLAGAVGMTAVTLAPQPNRVQHPRQSSHAVSMVASTAMSRRASGVDESEPSRGPRRWRLSRVAVTAGLAAVSASIWGISTSGQPVGATDRLLQARRGVSQTHPCLVEYTLRKDSGSEFSADLAITNTSGQELQDWTMHFTFPGDQVVIGTDLAVRQQDAIVEVRPMGLGAKLAPGVTQRAVLTGRYTGTNRLPVEFRIDAQSCRAQVSGISGSIPSPQTDGSPSHTGGKSTHPATSKDEDEDDD